MPGIQNSKSTLDYLGTIGSNDRGDGVVLNATAKALADLASFLIQEATNNLEKKGNVATGDTASSMKIVNLNLQAVKMSLEVEILSTYKFLDQGVKGVGGVGNGKYSFKTKFVSKKMAAAILKWLKTRSMSGRVKYKGVSRNERKNKRIHKAVNAVKSREALAYAVASSIKRKGIKRTLFFTNAITETQKKQKELFADALRIDIINSLNIN